MIGSKIGTKATPQGRTGPVGVEHQSDVNTLSIADKEKLGDRDVGQVLNEIADPNYVDPAKKTRAVGNDKLDKEAFFKLMLAQMKHQDPTNPMQSHEMAAQLAQFTSLEQMQNVNKTLDQMLKIQKPGENFQALSYIGKAVAGDSSKVVRSPDDHSHDFKFNLPQNASEVVVKVRNADGNVVREYNMQGLKQGDNKVTWNGEDDKGNKQPVGEYQFLVEAKNDTGQKLAVKTEFNGVITGVNFSVEGPVLMIGNQSVRLRDVRKIIDPSLTNKDQNIKDVTMQDLKKDDAAKQNENISSAPSAKAVDPTAPNSKVMQSVGLSRELQNKLSKEAGG